MVSVSLMSFEVFEFEDATPTEPECQEVSMRSSLSVLGPSNGCVVKL